MVNLAWDERDWLLCDCGCSHQCHLCCHWQGAQLVLCHIQLFIAPHPPCRKTAVVVQWHKGGSRRSRSQARSSGKHSSGAAPGHSHCQSVLQPSSAPSSPTKTGLGQWRVVRTNLEGSMARNSTCTSASWSEYIPLPPHTCCGQAQHPGHCHVRQSNGPSKNHQTCSISDPTSSKQV